MNKLPKAKSGMERIRDERKRQIEKEGWTAAHDDQHAKGEMQQAGKCYESAGDGFVPQRLWAQWPWDYSWWKPSVSAERNFEKAGALYQAEADRLSRAKMQREAVAMEMEVERVAAKLDKPMGSAPAAPQKKGKA